MHPSQPSFFAFGAKHGGAAAEAACQHKNRGGPENPERPGATYGQAQQERAATTSNEDTARIRRTTTRSKGRHRDSEQPAEERREEGSKPSALGCPPTSSREGFGVALEAKKAKEVDAEGAEKHADELADSAAAPVGHFLVVNVAVGPSRHNHESSREPYSTPKDTNPKEVDNGKAEALPPITLVTPFVLPEFNKPFSSVLGADPGIATRHDT